MLKVNQIKLRPGHSKAALGKKAAELLRVPEQDIMDIKILRRSIDARKKPDIFYIYTLEVAVKNEERVLRRFRGRENQVCRAEETVYHFPEAGKRIRKHPTVIVGMGPAGLFCGYFLALHGYCPILLERGRRVEERRQDVERFWETGQLDPASNVQFGEGGAGTFSDGKLNTLVKDKNGRNGIVLETFVRFGAKASILYEAKPHIGTDVLCGVVKRMREEIIRLGGQVRFESQVTDICTEQDRVTGVIVNNTEQIPCGQLVMAVGHSARDTLFMLYDRHVPMEAKAFAVGLRAEHPQAVINESQYGMAEPGLLGAAPYKVAAKAHNGRGVYSFCMCPGGYVVNASSEEGRLAVNGMSYSDRSGQNANSAIIVTVTPEDFGSEHPLAGIGFQRRLEERAYRLGEGKIPVQRYVDFKRSVQSNQGRENAGETEIYGAEYGGSVSPQCKGAYHWADVSGILPGECSEAIVDGMEAFSRQIPGFNRPDVCLSGVESRTSSPVRILRDGGLQSKLRGLYPCGEGAGYAGGIVSAAMDGLRVAEAIAGEFAPGAGCDSENIPACGKTKQEIRRSILEIRDRLDGAERERAALLLTERIAGHQWFYRAEFLLCFVNFGSEISTREIIMEGLKAGKRVYVPKVLWEGAVPEMRFYKITSLEELKTGYRGIPEPSGSLEEYLYSDAAAERTLMLMPGVAFDNCRRRLGYGKGFYDRYLAGKPVLQQRTIGAGYLCQMVEKLPEEDTDIRPYQVICV